MTEDIVYNILSNLKGPCSTWVLTTSGTQITLSFYSGGGNKRAEYREEQMQSARENETVQTG